MTKMVYICFSHFLHEGSSLKVVFKNESDADAWVKDQNNNPNKFSSEEFYYVRWEIQTKYEKKED